MIKKILHFLVRLLLILLLMALVLGSILLYNLQMNKSFITTFYTVTVDKPVEDLRIVLLSDLHLSEYGTDNADLVQKVRNLAPDLIAVAGDMDIDTNPDYSLVLSLMRQLVDIAPVYYAPGNHEWAARYANGCDTIFDDIEATGVHWMNGTYEDAVINGKKLRIGGFFEWPRAQLERENIFMRTRMGMKERVRSGLWPAAIFPLLACVMVGRSRPRIIRSPLLLAAPEVVARLHCALLGHSGLDGGLYHLGPGVLDPAHVAEAAALAAVLHAGAASFLAD